MLRMRPYKPCDAKYIAGWITEERLFYQWSAGKMGEYPLTEEMLKAHCGQYDDSDSFWGMTALDGEGVPRGWMIMRFLDQKKRDLRFGFIVVDPAMRGKGYGKEMLLLAQRYAFDILKADRVSLGVFANNPKAMYCYQAAGLTEKQGGRKTGPISMTSG